MSRFNIFSFFRSSYLKAEKSNDLIRLNFWKEVRSECEEGEKPEDWMCGVVEDVVKKIYATENKFVKYVTKRRKYAFDDHSFSTNITIHLGGDYNLVVRHSQGHDYSDPVEILLADGYDQIYI